MTDHLILLIGVFVMVAPVGFLVWQLLSTMEWAALIVVVAEVWRSGISSVGPGADVMMWNSLVLALGLAVVKGVVAMMAAYALVFFRLPKAGWWYAAILVTMFFPIESRIMPTFLVTSELGLLNSYSGMILPVAASGLGVLVFRQYLLQIPPEMIEAARIDGAGPMRVLVDFIIPMSVPMIAALFAILFVLGWNQYVWPIMITTTSQSHDTLVRGMANAGFAGTRGQVLALMALAPPGIVVVLLQRWLMRGLTSGIH